MLGVSLSDQVRDEEILRRIRITDLAQRISSLKQGTTGKIVGWHGQGPVFAVDPRRSHANGWKILPAMDVLLATSWYDDDGDDEMIRCLVFIVRALPSLRLAQLVSIFSTYFVSPLNKGLPAEFPLVSVYCVQDQAFKK